jgi:beta-galactosidase
MKNLNNFAVGIVILLIILCHTSVTAQNKAEIKIFAGVPALFINDKLYPPFAYMSYLGEMENYKELEKTGIHLYCFPAYLGDRGINSRSGIGPFRNPVWIGEDQYDFSSIIKDFEKIVKSDSQAKIIIRLHLDPPVWWEKSNPDASGQLEDGSTFRQCFASEKWQNETGKVFKDCIKWLLKSPYSKYLIGIHVAAGFTEEWFYHPPQFDDINQARINAFREWLRNKYENNNSKLKAAWNDPEISFETSRPGEINQKNPETRWRDPEKEQNIIDTYQFNSEILVDNIKYFCRIVKNVSKGKLLTGVFFGYHYYLTDPRRGHGALSKLLDCKDLDYLSSPNAYNRIMGEDWPPMSAIQSIQMHGKLWLAENDTRTSITTLLREKAPEIAPSSGYYDGGVWLGPDDLETSVSFLWMNAGRMLTQGYGGWWFDMWGGWFSHPQLLNVIEKSTDFYVEYTQITGEEMKAEVCVIVDEQISFWDASYGQLSGEILSNRHPLAKTGAPYDLFLRTDTDNIPVDQYKIIWLLGLPELNEQDTSRIKEWIGQGITVLWTNGDGTKLYKNNKEEFFKDKIFWSDSQLRQIYNNSGVHVYLNSGDVFYIGRNWFCIHSIFGGKRTVNFPFFTQVIDPLENRILSQSTNILELTLEPKSTIILRLNSNK